MASINTLGRNERLKSRKQIGLLFEKGRRFRSENLRVHYLLSGAAGEKGYLQVGVAVSSRQFPKAHHRNRIKRMLRESWRLHKNELREVTKEGGRSLFVFIIFTSGNIPDFVSVEAEVRNVIRKLSEAIQP
jgi:ribonuclease P protein component